MESAKEIERQIDLACAHAAGVAGMSVNAYLAT